MEVIYIYSYTPTLRAKTVKLIGGSSILYYLVLSGHFGHLTS